MYRDVWYNVYDKIEKDKTYFENFIIHIPFIGNVYGAWNGNLLEIVLANTQPAKNYFGKIWQENFNKKQVFVNTCSVNFWQRTIVLWTSVL